MSRSFLRLGAFVALVTMASLSIAADRAGLDEAFRGLSTYDWGGNRAPLERIDQAIGASARDAALRKRLETRLVAVLRSNAPRAAKDFACRKLCLIGTTESVPALAALLPDKDLSHMARYALERMPYPQAAEALRDALRKASGKTKVGVINSLGMREDTEAVGTLIGLLKDVDSEIAAAAAIALGRAGTPQAARALADFRAKAPKALQAVAVDASLDVAERLVRQGDRDQAAKIYQELEAQSQPPHVRLAAFRGLVAARPAEAAPRLVKALAGHDQMLRRQAAQIIAETPGKEATRMFADALSKLPPVGQVLLLGALAAREDPAARPAVLEAVKSEEKNVRNAAVAALGATGNASDVKLLAWFAASGDKDAAAAARSSLARLEGDDVNQAVVAAMKGAAPGVRAELIRSLAARNAKACVATVVEGVQDSDASVRLAALEALGALGGPEHTAVAVKTLKAAKDAKQRAAAEKALLAICSRGRERSAGAVLAGLQRADALSRCALLRALARVRGARALAAVQSATADKDEQVRDEAVRVLSAWPDPAAARHLLKLARSADKMGHRVLALRGYVRLAGLQKTDTAKMKMLTEAMRLAKRPEEKKLILGALGNVRTPESLKLIMSHLDDRALVEEASSAAVRIARNVAGRNKVLVRNAMARVLAKARNKRTRRDAQRMLDQLKK